MMKGGMAMKRVVLIVLGMVLVMTCARAQAQEKLPLGNTNFTVKLDYIVFTHRHFDPPEEDDGLYLGLEGYKQITQNPNWYLGGEIGSAANITVFGGEEINFIPVELNGKYAKEIAPNLIADFGGGLSYSYVELQYRHVFLPHENERDGWLLGAQFFADLTYTMGRLCVGVNAKYQITEDFKDEDLDLNNWRLGVQIGLTF